MEMAKPPDSEKLTLNLGICRPGPHRSFGARRLLFQSIGFHSHGDPKPARTAHADVAENAASRLTLELGLRTYTRRDLEAVQAAGERLRIRVLGLATIADDVSPDLARATIESIVVLGALHAPAEVETALADRLG